jgi:hypothetical protein
MKLELGDLACHYCGSPDLECTELFPDLAKEKLEDWSLETTVPDVARENFSGWGSIKLLVRCRKCSRWFEFNAVSETVTVKGLPMSPDYGDLPRATLELDPVTLTARFLHVRGVSLAIEDSILVQDQNLVDNVGPFYPYPLGVYSLTCRLTEVGSRGKTFRSRIRCGHPFLDSDPIDLSFYEAVFEWADDAGCAALRLINQNKDVADRRAIDEAWENARKVGRDPDEVVSIGNRVYGSLGQPESVAEAISKVAGISRGVQACRFLSWLETELRKYVWNAYLARYKPADEHNTWWKACFPENVRNNIDHSVRGERRLHKPDGRFWPMDYTDFDDLMELMERDWTHNTARDICNPRAVRGHFEYLKHFRNVVAHSRYLSHSSLMELQDNALPLGRELQLRIFDRMPFPFYQHPLVFPTA